jgi:hypothetical protein
LERKVIVSVNLVKFLNTHFVKAADNAAYKKGLAYLRSTTGDHFWEFQEELDKLIESTGNRDMVTAINRVRGRTASCFDQVLSEVLNKIARDNGIKISGVGITMR